MANIDIPIKGFEGIMQGGIPRGFSLLLNGSAGTLRSSFAYSILAEGAKANGFKGLYIAVEQRPCDLQTQFASMGHVAGEAVRFAHLPTLMAEDAESSDAPTPYRRFSNALRKLCEKEKPDVVVIDAFSSCGEYLPTDGGRAAAFRILEWFKAKGITLLLIADAPGGGCGCGSLAAELEYLVDGMFHFTRFESLNKRFEYIGLRCQKLRSVEHSRRLFILNFENGALGVLPYSPPV